MKKLFLLFIGFMSYTVAFAQNEKVNGDEMVSKENYSGAAVMYRMCMDKDVECRLKLVRLLYHEKIDPQTPDELYKLINPLVKKNNAEAQFYMGSIYQKGIGVKPNVKEAKKWYQKGAAQGYADARYQLELMSNTPPGNEKTDNATGNEKTDKTEKKKLPLPFKRNSSKNSFERNAPKNLVNIGVGIGGTLYNGFAFNSRWPVFSLSYERRILNNLFNDKSALGIGGIAGFSSVIDPSETRFDYRSTDFLVGIRASLYYQLINKLDLYAGVMGGFIFYQRTSMNWSNSDYFTSNGRGGEPSFGVFAGARYHFLDFISIFAEGGYGHTYANAGLSFRF